MYFTFVCTWMITFILRGKVEDQGHKSGRRDSDPTFFTRESSPSLQPSFTSLYIFQSMGLCEILLRCCEAVLWAAAQRGPNTYAFTNRKIPCSPSPPSPSSPSPPPTQFFCVEAHIPESRPKSQQSRPWRPNLIFKVQIQSSKPKSQPHAQIPAPRPKSQPYGPTKPQGPNLCQKAQIPRRRRWRRKIRNIPIHQN